MNNSFVLNTFRSASLLLFVFLFADISQAQVSRQDPNAGVKKFNAANSAGFQNLNEIVEKYPVANVDLMEYYTKFIKFKLDNAMLEAIPLFLSKLKPSI